MIKIELVVLKGPESGGKDSLDNEEFSDKPLVLEVPAIPRKGDRFRFLIKNEPTILWIVSDICFDQRARKKCAVIVFVKHFDAVKHSGG